MLAAYAAAVRQLGDPPIKQVIWRVALWTAAIYVVLGVGLWTLLAGFDPSSSFGFIGVGWLETALVWLAGVVVAFLGAFVFFALFWLLFAAVVQTISGFYLERVIGAVEARHYPDLPAAREIPIADTLVSSLRLVAAMVGFNLLALPLYLIPLFGVVVFYLINGYLLGREYFEQVALRRLDEPAARRLRRAERGQVLVSGLITTLLFSVPIVNLVAPIIAAAAMVHLFERMPARHAAAGAPASRNA